MNHETRIKRLEDRVKELELEGKDQATILRGWIGRVQELEGIIEALGDERPITFPEAGSGTTASAGTCT